MIAHLPVLQVIVPLIAAPLCMLLRHGTLAWVLAVAVSWASFAVALGLLGQTLDGSVLSYQLGSWAPPWGIEYRVDVVNAFVLLIVSGISAVVLPYARRSVASGNRRNATREPNPTIWLADASPIGTAASA